MSEFIAAFVISYFIHMLGVTVGYHRLLSHRAFSCLKVVEYFWVFAGYLAFQGSPIWWATIHRAHHKYVDTELDPHAPKYGLLKAHTGWCSDPGYADHLSPETQTKDLLKDPIYRFLEQNGQWHKAHLTNFIIGMSFRLVLLVCFGWVIALASLLSALVVHQVPLLLNVVCHLPKLGYKVYATEDDSVNVWWVGLLAMGEGWHNNHHASPGSAKSGMRIWEFDLSWHLISLMKFLGIAQRVNVATHDQLVRLTSVNKKAYSRV